MNYKWKTQQDGVSFTGSYSNLKLCFLAEKKLKFNQKPMHLLSIARAYIQSTRHLMAVCGLFGTQEIQKNNSLIQVMHFYSNSLLQVSLY